MDLQKKKQQIQKELDKLNEEYVSRERGVKTSKEYSSLYRRYRKLEREEGNLLNKKGEIIGEIRLKYLTDDVESPIYEDTAWGRGRNIRVEVLSSIKRALSIKNISLIKKSEIENITYDLIKKDVKENEEIKSIDERLHLIQEEQNNIEEQQTEMLQKETGAVYKEIIKKDKEIGRLDELEEEERTKHDKKKRKRKEFWDEKKRVEEKLENNRSGILKEIKIGVTKELILSNLEEEEE